MNTIPLAALTNIANTTGIGWEDALQKAKAWVANLTLEEKVGLLTGEPKGPCIGKFSHSMIFHCTYMKQVTLHLFRV